MPDFGDISLANLPEPRSVEEVVAIALALEREAEGRCSAVARELRTVGSPAVAALLEDLGGEHGARAGRLEAEATQDPAGLLPRSFSENGAAACDIFSLTPYRVYASAVSSAQQTFELYSYLAAVAENEVRDYAERLAGEQLSRAARLRVERRRAYHAERRRPRTDAYPAAGLVESEADFLAAAFAVEDRLAQRLAEAAEKEPALSSTCQPTRQKAAELRRASERAGEPGGPMAEELARFSRSAATNGPPGRDMAAPARHLHAECERAFAFYDTVASAPVNEAVMLLAQALCQAAVERIRQVQAFAGAPDESSMKGPQGSDVSV